jgi:stress-induced morphogen
MYAIEVTASDFDGRSKIKQHQLVTKLISDDVKQWHGARAPAAAAQLVTEALVGCSPVLTRVACRQLLVMI